MLQRTHQTCSHGLQSQFNGRAQVKPYDTIHLAITTYELVNVTTSDFMFCTHWADQHAELLCAVTLSVLAACQPVQVSSMSMQSTHSLMVTQND